MVKVLCYKSPCISYRLLTNRLHGGEFFLRNKSSASQEIPRILWDPKFHYRIHKSLPTVLILVQLNLIHAFLSHFLKIYFNIVLPSIPRSSKWSFSTKSPHQTLYTSLLSPMTSTCPTRLVILYFITQILLVRSTNHKTPLYIVFSTTLLPCPSWAIFLCTLVGNAFRKPDFKF